MSWKTIAWANNLLAIFIDNSIIFVSTSTSTGYQLVWSYCSPQQLPILIAQLTPILFFYNTHTEKNQTAESYGAQNSHSKSFRTQTVRYEWKWQLTLFAKVCASAFRRMILVIKFFFFALLPSFGTHWRIACARKQGLLWRLRNVEIEAKFSVTAGTPFERQDEKRRVKTLNLNKLTFWPLFHFRCLLWDKGVT